MHDSTVVSPQASRRVAIGRRLTLESPGAGAARCHALSVGCRLGALSRAARCRARSAVARLSRGAGPLGKAFPLGSSPLMAGILQHQARVALRDAAKAGALRTAQRRLGPRETVCGRRAQSRHCCSRRAASSRAGEWDGSDLIRK